MKKIAALILLIIFSFSLNIFIYKAFKDYKISFIPLIIKEKEIKTEREIVSMQRMRKGPLDDSERYETQIIRETNIKEEIKIEKNIELSVQIGDIVNFGDNIGNNISIISNYAGRIIEITEDVQYRYIIIDSLVNYYALIEIKDLNKLNRIINNQINKIRIINSYGYVNLFLKEYYYNNEKNNYTCKFCFKEAKNFILNGLQELLIITYEHYENVYILQLYNIKNVEGKTVTATMVQYIDGKYIYTDVSLQFIKITLNKQLIVEPNNYVDQYFLYYYNYPTLP